MWISWGLILDFFSGWLGTLRALSTRINFRSFFQGGVGKRPMKSLGEAKRNKNNVSHFKVSEASRLWPKGRAKPVFWSLFLVLLEESLLVSSVQNSLEPISVFLFSCKCKCSGPGSNPFSFFFGAKQFWFWLDLSPKCWCLEAD